jgi:hypothetical protein
MRRAADGRCDHRPGPSLCSAAAKPQVPPPRTGKYGMPSINLCALHNRIEHFFNLAKNSPRLCTRYHKLTESFATFVLLHPYLD